VFVIFSWVRVARRCAAPFSLHLTLHLVAAIKALLERNKGIRKTIDATQVPPFIDSRLPESPSFHSILQSTYNVASDLSQLTEPDTAAQDVAESVASMWRIGRTDSNPFYSVSNVSNLSSSLAQSSSIQAEIRARVSIAPSSTVHAAVLPSDVQEMVQNRDQLHHKLLSELKGADRELLAVMESKKRLSAELHSKLQALMALSAKIDVADPSRKIGLNLHQTLQEADEWVAIKLAVPQIASEAAGVLADLNSRLSAAVEVEKRLETPPLMSVPRNIPLLRQHEIASLENQLARLAEEESAASELIQTFGDERLKLEVELRARQELNFRLEELKQLKSQIFGVAEQRAAVVSKINLLAEYGDTEEQKEEQATKRAEERQLSKRIFELQAKQKTVTQQIIDVSATFPEVSILARKVVPQLAVGEIDDLVVQRTVL
jgi:hypothetical protein